MKKGFTLIELLAVIVIIAIITLITIPVIGNIIESSKKEAFKRSVEGLAREYEYKEVQTDTKLGSVDACTLQETGTSCNIRGTIDRDIDGNIIVDVENGKYQAKGKIGEMTVTNCDESVGGTNEGSGQGNGENNNSNENNNGNNNGGNENNNTNQNTQTPDLINIEGATIDPIEAVDYDGTEKTPTVVVKYNNVLLTKNTDYTVSYMNNINVGTATVTVTGIGNYTGTKTKTFTINAINYPNTSVVPETNLTYNGLEQSLIKSTNIDGDVYYNVGTELNSNNYLSNGNTTKPKRVDAGTYTVYYYVPASGNYNEIKGSVTSKINPKTLYAPYPDYNEYTGSTQNSGITCPTGSTAGGTMQAIEVGTYTQTCTINNTNNYKWYDTNSSTVSIEWEINLPQIGYEYYSNTGYDYSYYGHNNILDTLTLDDFTKDYRTLGKMFYSYELSASEDGETIYGINAVGVCGNESGQRFCIGVNDAAHDYAETLNEKFSYNCDVYYNHSVGADINCTGNDLNVSISTETGYAHIIMTEPNGNQRVECYYGMEYGVDCY